MAINKNHEFEELDGVKCGIAEKNVSRERVQFLKQLLIYNGFTVIVVQTPAPKAAPAPVVKAEDGTVILTPTPPAAPAPETYTVGVTDYTFNTTNAIFGRSLKTPDGNVVTMAYWQQKEVVSHDDIPYYERN